MRRAPWLACTLLLLPACTSHGNTTPSPDAQPLTDGGLAHPCTLPGSIVFTATGHTTVSGGSTTWPDLTFLHLPAGFCAHYFATVGNARQIRFAPGGELFVASPSALTTGGNAGAGLSAIVVLPDDDLDGVADTTLTFLSFPSAPLEGSTNQGILFTPGFFYYQDGTPPGTAILRVPYAPGDRKPSGAGAQVADVTVYTSGLHWPKTLDMADDGTLYVGNGGDQGEACVEPHPFHGGILQIDPAPGGPHPNGVVIAQGMRNPVAVRCARGHDLCFATELAKDYSWMEGGREKLVPIRKGDDWGFPCCAARGLPYTGTLDQNMETPSCANVAAETGSFYIGDTPFGLDFERGRWPAPWTGAAFVATHGASGTWQGARVVAIPMNPTTGMPDPSTDVSDAGGDSEVEGGVEVGMMEFARGWDDGTLSHGRPASVAFSDDGRLFVADDHDGVIFWIAPVD